MREPANRKLLRYALAAAFVVAGSALLLTDRSAGIAWALVVFAVVAATLNGEDPGRTVAPGRRSGPRRS